MIRDNFVYLVVLIPVAIGAFALINSATNASEVAAREQVTTGTLVAHQEWNHNQWQYRFQVERRPYTGLDRVRSGTPLVDQPVAVYYDPLDPTTNGLGSFGERSRGFWGPAIAVILLGTGLAAALLFGGSLLDIIQREPYVGKTRTDRKLHEHKKATQI